MRGAYTRTMDGENFKFASFVGTPGCVGIGWFMMQIYPEAPVWVLNLVLVASMIMLGVSAWFWIKHFTRPKPKQATKDAFLEYITEADALIKESVSDYVDLVFYQKSVREWIEAVTEFLNKNVNSSEVHMFTTIAPMITGDEELGICRAAIAARHGKLRLISARYYKAENLR